MSRQQPSPYPHQSSLPPHQQPSRSSQPTMGATIDPSTPSSSQFTSPLPPSVSTSISSASTGSSPLSPTDLYQCFSLLPSIYCVLHSIETSKDPAVTHKATQSLILQLQRAQTILAALPAITVSRMEQKKQYQQLQLILQRKQQLAARYQLLADQQLLANSNSTNSQTATQFFPASAATPTPTATTATPQPTPTSSTPTSIG